MNIEYLKSGWFPALLIVMAVGLSGCCSDGCCLGKAFGKRSPLKQEVISTCPCGDPACGRGATIQGPLSEYGNVIEHGNYVSEAVSSGSSTRTASLSSGSTTKSCGST